MYAANLYDAITLYALAVAEAINKSIPISSPKVLDILKQYVNRRQAMRCGSNCKGETDPQWRVMQGSQVAVLLQDIV